MALKNNLFLVNSSIIYFCLDKLSKEINKDIFPVDCAVFLDPQSFYADLDPGTSEAKFNAEHRIHKQNVLYRYFRLFDCLVLQEKCILK